MPKEMTQVHQNLRRAIPTFLPSRMQHAVSFTPRNHRTFQKPYLSNRPSNSHRMNNRCSMLHSSELIRKCSSRLYFLRQLKRSGVAPSELVQFYVTCIRPVLEYASPVFHRSLPNYISEDLERIQRRAFRIIHPDLSYSVALETVGLPKLHERREKISIDLFDEIVCNPTHSLHSLLPQRKSCKYALRRKSEFTLPLCKTERLKISFIFSHVYKM